jgi:hypothetical protein
MLRLSSTILLTLCACLDVAEERVERDLAVGKRENAGARVAVDGGLAAVRGLDTTRLELWANAPSLDVDLSLPSDAGRFELRVRNTLPDAELALHDERGRAIELEPIATTFATERRAAFDARGGGRFRLRLGAPDAAREEPFAFLVFADVQDALPRVGDIFAKMNRELDARFVMMPGDITERGGAAELRRFQQEQLALRVPIFVTLGNHELGTTALPYHDYFGRGSQSFTFRGARFTLLDSASATLDPTVYDWLDGWLAAGRGRTHLVFMHIAPVEPSGLRNGCFSSRAESDKVLARMARGGVTAAFYGHVHSYYSFEHAGIPAFISGGGGAIPERFDGIGRHFLVVHVDPAARAFESRIVRVD